MLSKVVTSVVRPFADTQTRHEHSCEVVLPILDEIVNDMQWAQDFRFDAFKSDDEHHWAEPADVPLRRGDSHGLRRARREEITKCLRTWRVDHRRFQESNSYASLCG